MNENELESKRIEAMSEELTRLHALIKPHSKNDISNWALSRIEELQAVMVGAQCFTEAPSHTPEAPSEDEIN